MMSDEEEYDDELPPISVNSTPRGPDIMSMPTADTVASERAREEECERELQRLRAEHDADIVVALAHGDSSGSEGEAALAAAVTALRVRPALREAAPPLRRLLPALLQRLPAPRACLHLVRAADDHTLLALTEEVCVAAPAARRWTEAAAAAAWLCAACVCRPSAPRRRLRRALHLLLAGQLFAAATPEELEAFTSAVVAGIGDCDAKLELADAVSPAAAAAPAAALGAAALAAALAEVTDLPHAAPGECLCVSASRGAARAWRAGGARGVRVAGRVLRACTAAACPGPRASCPGPRASCPGPRAACRGPRARLLAALAAPPPPRAAAAPERLEVLVGASKLQLLFRD